MHFHAQHRRARLLEVRLEDLFGAVLAGQSAVSVSISHNSGHGKKKSAGNEVVDEADTFCLVCNPAGARVLIRRTRDEVSPNGRVGWCAYKQHGLSEHYSGP